MRNHPSSLIFKAFGPPLGAARALGTRLPSPGPPGPSPPGEATRAMGSGAGSGAATLGAVKPEGVRTVEDLVVAIHPSPKK